MPIRFMDRITLLHYLIIILQTITTQKGKKTKRKDGSQKIVCKCGRIFIHTSKSKKYRRALFEEV